MTSVLHLGDWRQMDYPTPCCVITDPPYGIRHRRTDSSSWRKGDRSDFEHQPGERDIIEGDRDCRERDTALEAIGWDAAAVFGPRRIDLIPPWGCPRDLLVWDKGAGVGAGDLSLPWKPCWETVAIYGGGWVGARTSGVLRGSIIAYMAGNAPNGRRHPTEKPLSILRELVGKAPPGLPIVDPFMGSGSTGVAALEFGRNFYGAELAPEYFATARERLHNVTPVEAQQRGLWESLPAEES